MEFKQELKNRRITGKSPNNWELTNIVLIGEKGIM